MCVCGCVCVCVCGGGVVGSADGTQGRGTAWSGYTNPAADSIIYDPFLMDLE